MYIPIRINSCQDAKEITDIASDLGFNTFVSGKTETIDARSLMGLIALIGRSDLKFVAPDHADPYKTFYHIWKFAAQ